MSDKEMEVLNPTETLNGTGYDKVLKTRIRISLERRKQE